MLLQYFQGANGRNGDDGRNGTDGIPGTPGADGDTVSINYKFFAIILTRNFF